MKFEDMINTIQLGDCYELIKNIPDKSIDLIYVDIPYLIGTGGTSNTPIILTINGREMARALLPDIERAQAQTGVKLKR